MLEFDIPASPNKIINILRKQHEFELLEQNDDYILYSYDERIKIKLFFTDDRSIHEKLFFTSGTPEFKEIFLKKFPNFDFEKVSDDEDIFRKLKFSIARLFKGKW